MLMIAPTGGDTFTGNTGAAYTAAAAAQLEVGPGDVAMALKRGWLNTAYPSKNINASFANLTVGNVFNVMRANTNKWRAARGRVQEGAGNGRLLCIGNSITAGYGSGTPGSSSGIAPLAYPTKLAQILTSYGLTASNSSFIGGNNYTNFNDTDSRIVQGSWTNAGLGTFGGNALQLAATGQTLMSFTPANQVDTVQVLALRNNNTAITIAVDGGATLSTYNAFASGTLKVGISGNISLGSLGSHAIQANISSATSTYLVGMIAWNSAIKEMQVLRGGWHGAITANMTRVSPANNWPYIDGVQMVAPDLTLIALTRNDASSQTNLAAFMSQYTEIINAAKISGDVILVIEPLGQLGSAVYQPYVQAVYSLAQTNSLPLIDFSTIWDTYANVSAWYGDGTHPVGYGYAEMARPIAEILMAL